jgi:hypothetical protein
MLVERDILVEKIISGNMFGHVFSEVLEREES